MKIFIFDLETTGIPITHKKEFIKGNYKDQYYDFKDNSKYDSSRIVQFAWYLHDTESKTNTNINNIHSYIIKPDDTFKITNSHIHGITHENALKSGVKLSKLMNNSQLKNDLKSADFMCGHNVYFDLYILLNGLWRINYTKTIKRILTLMVCDNILCTGSLGKEITKLTWNHDGYKMPKLSVLYHYFYNDTPSILHDAKYDVFTTCEIFKKIYDLNNDICIKHELSDELLNQVDKLYIEHIINSNDDESLLFAGQKWTAIEEKQLMDEISSDLDVSTIAKNHKRTIGGINARLNKIIYKMHLDDYSIEDIIKITKMQEADITKIIDRHDTANLNKLIKPKTKNNVKNEIIKIKEQVQTIDQRIKEILKSL